MFVNSLSAFIIPYVLYEHRKPVIHNKKLLCHHFILLFGFFTLLLGVHGEGDMLTQDMFMIYMPSKVIVKMLKERGKSLPHFMKPCTCMCIFLLTCL